MQASFCASGLTKTFYAVPIPNGTLTFDELLEEAMDGKSVEPSIAKACRDTEGKKTAGGFHWKYID